MQGEILYNDYWQRAKQIIDENEKLKKRINKAILFIKETSEYYCDGVNEELLDILAGDKK